MCAEFLRKEALLVLGRGSHACAGSHEAYRNVLDNFVNAAAKSKRDTEREI